MTKKIFTHVLVAEVENEQIAVVSAALATPPSAVPSAHGTMQEETHRRVGSQVVQGSGESQLHMLQTSEFHGHWNLPRIQESGIKIATCVVWTLRLALILLLTLH